MIVLNEYTNHHYWDTYEKETWFCPNCGKQELWTSTDAGDYYYGSMSICTACGHGCYLCAGTTEVKEPNYVLILKQLREGKTSEPTTKQGR